MPITDGPLSTIARRAAGRRRGAAHGVASAWCSNDSPTRRSLASTWTACLSPTVRSPPSPAGRQDDRPSKRVAWPSAGAGRWALQRRIPPGVAHAWRRPRPGRSQCLRMQVAAVSSARQMHLGRGPQRPTVASSEGRAFSSPGSRRGSARAGESHLSPEEIGLPVAMAQFPPVLLPNACFRCEPHCRSVTREAQAIRLAGPRLVRGKLR